MLFSPKIPLDYHHPQYLMAIFMAIPISLKGGPGPWPSREICHVTELGPPTLLALDRKPWELAPWIAMKISENHGSDIICVFSY